VLEDSYHMITLDKERHIVVERTRAFIDRVVGEIGKAADAAPAALKLAA
jgi:carboxylesterase